MPVPRVGDEGLHPPGKSKVVVCFLRNTVIDNSEKKYDPLGPIASKGWPGPHCPLLKTKIKFSRHPTPQTDFAGFSHAS